MTTMKTTRRTLSLLVTVTVVSLIAACDETPGGNDPDMVSAQVRLTDAPFPFDLVSRVDVYIVSVDASENADTTSGTEVPGGAVWTNIAEPRQTFNLLELQRGVTAIIGEGAIPAAQYAAVRLVIDTEQSSITLTDGGEAFVQWPVQGELALHALVEEALAIYPSGTEMNVVIDFDVGRSFYYIDAGADTLGTISGSGYFVFISWIRAVNEAGTGGIQGTVTADLDGDGDADPVEKASVTAMRGDLSAGPLTWSPVATGRTDAAGTFVIDFLTPGTYILSAAPPASAGAGTATRGGIQVSIGERTGVEIALPDADPVSLEIVGESSVALNHEIVLRAVVLDADGDTLAGQPVSWQAWPEGVVDLYDPQDGRAPVGEFVAVRGRTAGVTTIYANSLGLFAQLSVQSKDPNAAPVATVELVPASQTVSVFDSLAISATLKDAHGGVLQGRLVSWSVSDTDVLHLGPASGSTAHFTAKEAGTATVTATSEGKEGTATVTVSH
jgi:hypothetical protein